MGAMRAWRKTRGKRRACSTELVSVEQIDPGREGLLNYIQFRFIVYKMKRLPLNVQTLYADLMQAASFGGQLPGSISRRTINGKVYLYATEKHGASRQQVFLGPADDPGAIEKETSIRRAAEDAKQRRSTVAMLKRAGLPAPSLEAGRLLEALANAGIFANGMLLVGTIAYQIYAPFVGVMLTGSTLQTQDADLAATSLAVQPTIEGINLLDVLRRADETFVPALSLNQKDMPKRFRSAAGFDVDIITRYRSRSDDDRPVALNGLECAAQPLRFLEFLMEDPVDAIALYNVGIPVRIPQPARYAVHKLIIAQERKVDPAKRQKDLMQARTLMDALSEIEPGAVEDALENARKRGPRWRGNIDKSLAAL
jgi:hypothetical protein